MFDRAVLIFEYLAARDPSHSGKVFIELFNANNKPSPNMGNYGEGLSFLLSKIFLSQSKIA